MIGWSFDPEPTLEERMPKGSKKLTGHWQKEVPTLSGYYWTADRDGLITGIQLVLYNGDGKLIFAGMPVGPNKTEGLQGWWWSEPIEKPTPPTEAW